MISNTFPKILLDNISSLAVRGRLNSTIFPSPGKWQRDIKVESTFWCILCSACIFWAFSFQMKPVTCCWEGGSQFPPIGSTSSLGKLRSLLRLIKLRQTQSKLFPILLGQACPASDLIKVLILRDLHSKILYSALNMKLLSATNTHCQ